MAYKSIRRKRSNASGITPEVRSVPNGDIIAGSEDRLEADDNDESIDGDEHETSGTVDGSGNDYDIVEPTTFSGSDSGAGTGAGTGTGRKRGRPAGTGKKRAAKSTEATKAITGVLYSTHLMLANWMEAEEIAITDDEAEQLGSAIVKVSQLYDLGVMGEKAAAWINLSIAMGSVYGPRAIALSKRKKDADLQQKGRNIRSIG